MRYTMFRLLMSSTVDDQLNSVQQIRARDVGQAVKRAQDLLRSRQIISPERDRWDRWHLGAKDSATKRWVAILSGTVGGILEAELPTGARERLNGPE